MTDKLDLSPEAVAKALADLRYPENGYGRRHEIADMLEALAASHAASHAAAEAAAAAAAEAASHAASHAAALAASHAAERDTRVTELEALVKAYEDGTVPNLTAVYIAGGKDMADKIKAAEARVAELKHVVCDVIEADERGQGVGYAEAMDRLRAIAGETK